MPSSLFLSLTVYLSSFIFFSSTVVVHYAIGFEICNAFGYKEENLTLTPTLTGAGLATTEMFATL